MGLFNKNQLNAQPQDDRYRLEQKYKLCRGNLIAMVAFTVVNVAFCIFGVDLYFLFSAYIPLFCVDLGNLLTGRYPAETYTGDFEGMNIFNDTFFYVTVVIALALITVYFLCWLLSKKHKVAWLIVALSLFAADTAGMVFLGGLSWDNIIDILFHIWVLYYLIIGVVAHFKLRKLDEQEILLTPEDINIQNPDIQH